RAVAGASAVTRCLRLPGAQAGGHGRARRRGQVLAGRASLGRGRGSCRRRGKRIRGCGRRRQRRTTSPPSAAPPQHRQHRSGMIPPAIAAVGLGGNLGDAASTVREALRALDDLPSTRLLRASPLYRTAAWGNTAQPDFVNAAALLETRLEARTLLDELLGIERHFGREREAAVQWGPRILDLDLLLYGDAVIDEPGLRVPHPYLHERAFALVPLAQIGPSLQVPG